MIYAAVCVFQSLVSCFCFCQAFSDLLTTMFQWQQPNLLHMEHQLCKPQKLCSICWRVLCLLWSSVKDARKTKSWRGSKQSVQLSLELAVEMSMSTMAVIWVSLFCLGSIFPQRVLGIDLSFSILASFWLHGLHFTACSCSS